MEAVKNMWEDFKWEVNYQIRSIRAFFRSIKTGIQNLWEWKSVIYNDRWWDEGFFHSILKKKMQTMHDHWDESQYVGSENEKESLRELILILEEIEGIEEMEDDYTIEDDEAADKRIDELYAKFGELLFQIETREVSWEEDGTTKSDIKTMSNFRRFWD